MRDYPQHYCGLFGIFGHPEAAELTKCGLFALQHRGQESAGIVTCHEGQFYDRREMGLVAQVFQPEHMTTLQGDTAVGHTRYSTTGSSRTDNAQPIIVEGIRGKIAIAHNGNLTNAVQIRDQLEAKGSIFQTTVDSEVILHLLSQPPHQNDLVQALRHVEGAFSLIIMTPKELIGVRDPHGFRPLSLGRLKDAYVLASETCAFDLIQAEFVRDVKPGEIVVIDRQGLRSIDAFPLHQRRSLCIFEFVYFARPDSNLSGRNVYETRVAMGRQLAREHPIDADVIVPIPDSGNPAALGYSLESQIPFQMAFVRNHYVGRSFLQPSQFIRDFNVRIKLNLIPELVRGKRVIAVDDSIVRGTTSRTRVNNLKEAGAKEVHMLVSCPPHKHPCAYGIDFPDPSKLLAAKWNRQQICEFLKADSLAYLSMEGMLQATGLNPDSFCTACYDGNYPVACNPPADKHYMEIRRQETLSLLNQDQPLPWRAAGTENGVKREPGASGG